MLFSLQTYLQVSSSSIKCNHFPYAFPAFITKPRRHGFATLLQGSNSRRLPSRSARTDFVQRSREGGGKGRLEHFSLANNTDRVYTRKHIPSEIADATGRLFCNASSVDLWKIRLISGSLLSPQEKKVGWSIPLACLLVRSVRREGERDWEILHMKTDGKAVSPYIRSSTPISFLLFLSPSICEQSGPSSFSWCHKCRKGSQKNIQYWNYFLNVAGIRMVTIVIQKQFAWEDSWDKMQFNYLLKTWNEGWSTILFS